MISICWAAVKLENGFGRMVRRKAEDMTEPAWAWHVRALSTLLESFWGHLKFSVVLWTLLSKFSIVSQSLVLKYTLYIPWHLHGPKTLIFEVKIWASHWLNTQDRACVKLAQMKGFGQIHWDTGLKTGTSGHSSNGICTIEQHCMDDYFSKALYNQKLLL